MPRCASRCRAFLILAFAAFATAAVADERPWRVVILNASDAHLPAFVVMDRATRDVLQAPGGRPVEIYAETLDFLRFPDAKLEPEVLALLGKKYANRPVDAVIAAATDALDFAERHRDALWPHAVIVFHSVWDDALRGRVLPPATTGIPLRLDIAGTAELALRLRPKTQRIVVIAGATRSGRRLVEMAREQLAPLAGRMAIDFWVNDAMDDLVDRIARLPPTAVVLYLVIYRDARGRTFVPREALAQLAAASSVPVFGVFDTYIGRGMAAGQTDDSAARGRQAARLVLDALGAPPGTPLPPPAPVPPTCLADARELARWSIAQDLLPADCTLRFAELSVWQRYRWQIVLALAIMASQSALIAALVLQRRRRRRAEHDTQAARADLAHAARVATLGELTASIAHQVKQPLSAILAHADTAELLLEREAPPIAEIQGIIAKIRSDDLRASDVITHLHELLGKRAMARTAVDVNGVVADTLRVLEAEARRRGVAVETDLAASLPAVVGDRVHLQQVILNLVLNAMDAVAPLPSRTRRVRVGTAPVAGRVEITVSDNGPGIDPAIAARLFGSFVTTKANGLGMGLSIARSIVEAHGGRIEAGDRSGGGAQFRVILPLPREAAATEASAPKGPATVRVGGAP